jgi:hypothetical protein
MKKGGESAAGPGLVLLPGCPQRLKGQDLVIGLATGKREFPSHPVTAREPGLPS